MFVNITISTIENPYQNILGMLVNSLLSKQELQKCMELIKVVPAGRSDLLIYWIVIPSLVDYLHTNHYMINKSIKS